MPDRFRNRARAARIACVAAAIVLLNLSGCPAATGGQRQAGPRAAAKSGMAAVETLRASRDKRELKNAALLLASSDSAAEHETLGRYLASEEFLARLDGPEEYQGSTASLRLARVMETLAENRLPSADRVLLGLIGAPGYQGHVLRVILLVRSLAAVRPSAPEAIRYWDAKSAPGSPLAQDVVEALCVNQSPPALALLERKFADPGHAKNLKVFWMRKLILPRRNDEPLLAACERMLAGPLPADLQPALVEALFDYQPSKWYRGDDPPRPPRRSDASAASRKVLERIGRYALAKVKLAPEQAAAVKAGLAELEKGAP